MNEKIVIAVLLGTLATLAPQIDPILMNAVIVCVGFAVDYTAHVTHQFHASASRLPPIDERGRSTTVHRRVYATLQSTGWPAVQSAVSTCLCIGPMVFYDVYSLACTARAIVIVVTVGLAHSLAILPALLALVPPKYTS